MTHASLEIFTPSYGPDLDCFALLADSRFQFASHIAHTAFVPPGDVKAFEKRCGSTAVIHSVADLLPKGLRSTFWLRDVLPSRFARLRSIQAVNPRTPFVPVRGWILQQIVKIAAVAGSFSDVALVLDSDSVIIADLLDVPDLDRVYRLPGGVNDSMHRHRIWQDVAADVLGLPRISYDDDYISPALFWRPEDLRRMIARIESHHSRPWWDVVCGKLHFSEATLFGRYASSELIGRDVSWTTDDRTATYWSTATVSMTGIADVVRGVSPTDLFLQIQSTSETPPDVRRAAYEAAVVRRGTNA